MIDHHPGKYAEFHDEGPIQQRAGKIKFSSWDCRGAGAGPILMSQSGACGFDKFALRRYITRSPPVLEGHADSLA